MFLLPVVPCENTSVPRMGFDVDLDKISHRIENSERASGGWSEPMNDCLSCRKHHPFNNHPNARNPCFIILASDSKGPNTLGGLGGWSLRL